MSRWPAASMTTPRACPTAKAERAFSPKYRSSSATASGSYSSISSPTRPWMRASRFAGSSPGGVSTTPPSSAKRRPRCCATTP